MKDINIVGYLTEQKLGDALIEIFPNCDIMPQFAVTVDTRKLKIDYAFYLKDVLVLVEFNGFYHYTKTYTQIRDMQLQSKCATNSIVLINIPYFIQLNNTTKSIFFSHDIFSDIICDINVKQDFSHGFIDTKCIRPTDFNIIGWYNFIKDCNSIGDVVKNEILDSLGDIELSMMLEYKNINTTFLDGVV